MIEIGSVQFDEIAPFVIRSLNEISTDVETNEKDSVVRVKLKRPDDKMKLMEGLLKEKFDIDSFKVREPSLNDIFVEYTEGAI